MNGRVESEQPLRDDDRRTLRPGSRDVLHNALLALATFVAFAVVFICGVVLWLGSALSSF